jgi:glycosyltransferase involved in cell wall biosynthesis
MKVCYLFQDQYPWDVRVDKIMNSLADHNIQGHIISRNQDRLVRKERLRENLYVHRMPSFSNRRLNELINFPAFFSPVWLKMIVSVVKNTFCNLIIVRDLPLSPTALIAGKLTSVPVLMDMAENYPAMIMDTWKYRGPNPIDRLVRNPWALKAMERLVLPKLDGILVVSKHSAERVVRSGCDKNSVWIVRNTPRLKESKSYRKLHSADDFRRLSDFILLYVGGLEETRGLETVIRALPEITKELPNALFIIVGKGTSESRLKNLVRILGIGDHVIFKGWVQHEMVSSIIDIADVCLVPHFVTEHTETTIPNKIFDYMAQKKPVVVTNAKALKEVIESCHCGMVYHHKDHHQLAELVIKLKDKRLRKQLGQSGYDAVKATYNWDIDEQALLSAVREISSRKPC